MRDNHGDEGEVLDGAEGELLRCARERVRGGGADGDGDQVRGGVPRGAGAEVRGQAGEEV